MRTISTLLHGPLAYLGFAILIILAGVAVPAAAAPESQGEGAYGAQTGCEVDEENDFRYLSIRPGIGQVLDPSGGDVSTKVYYARCPAEAYYLTYVDARGVLGTLSEAVTKEGTGVLESAQKAGINSAASSVFVLHAKLVALTIGVMNWAFEFDAVHTFRGPVTAITNTLGEKVFDVVLPIVYVMAVGYAAWISIGRGEVANGLVALLKSAVVGAIGTMVIAAPLWSVDMYQGTTNAMTRWVFSLVDEVAYSPDLIGDPDALGSPFEEANDTDESGGSGAPTTDRNTDSQGPNNNAANPLQGVSATIWRTFVHDPWSRLQISSTNYGADESGRNGIADQHAYDLLKIKEPSDRAKYLCDLSGKSCGGWFGDSNGDTPEDTGETTGGDTGGDTGGGQ